MDTEQQDLLKRYATGQNIAQIARETNRSYQSVRNQLNNVLRKLRIGKPGRELREKLEVLDSRVYRGSLKSFLEHGDSVTEYIAMRRAELDSINNIK